MSTDITSFGLGTVQFGLDYGVSNKAGKIEPAEVARIIQLAYNDGVQVIDTAQGYGNSEKILGEIGVPGFKVITKMSKEGCLHSSLENLRLESLYGLLAHNVDEVIEAEELWDRFSCYKEDGLVEKIGVSVYNGKQIDAVLDRYEIDIIQLPINIYDQRLLKSGHLKELKSRGVEIHARSVFLQGLVFLSFANLPKYFNGYRDVIESFAYFIKSNDISAIEAALGFVNSIEEIDNIVVGVNNIEQFKIILDTSRELKEIDYSEFSGSCDENLINPVNWKAHD